MEILTVERWGSEGIDQRDVVDRKLATVDSNFVSWVSILAVATSGPRLILEIALTTVGGNAHIASAGLKGLDAVLGVYLFVSLHRVVNGLFGFHRNDSVIAWLMAFGAFFCIMNVLLGWNGKPIGLPALVVGITVGTFLDITLGVMLFRLRDDPYGCLKAYALSHIASGMFIIAGAMF
ncbi:MAG: hypothetical protein ACHQ9S_24700 [Candidatus Binatia bacterium]